MNFQISMTVVGLILVIFSLLLVFLPQSAWTAWIDFVNSGGWLRFIFLMNPAWDGYRNRKTRKRISFMLLFLAAFFLLAGLLK